MGGAVGVSLLSLRADLPVSRSLRPLLSPPTPATLLDWLCSTNPTQPCTQDIRV